MASSSWEAGGSYTWNGHTLAHHRGWRACRAEKPLTWNLPQTSIESYTVFLGLDLWGGGKRSSMIKCKQKTDFAEIAHFTLGCVWCLRSLGGSRTGRGAGTAPALDTPLGMGLDWGQARASAPAPAGPHCCCCDTVWHLSSFHSCQDLINKIATSISFRCQLTLKYIYMYIIICTNAIRCLLNHSSGELYYLP